MTKFARVDNGVVAEVIETEQPIEDLFHPDLAALFVEAGDDVEPGWQYKEENEVFLPSAIITPTAEQIRASIPTLTPRQFWLAASRINITKTEVLALVDAMEDKQAAADMRIEVTETVSFQRTNPAVDQLATLLNIPPEQLDSLWTWAAQF